ncbi:hypothetical protein [Mariniflexile sp.]
MLPLDNANGGIYDINALVPLPPVIQGFLVEDQFNFIPTFSSLDIGGGNQTIGIGDLNKAYSPLSPPKAPKNSPFDNFYTNPLSSEQHIQFTLNNGNWLMDELKNNVAFYSCASTACTGTLGLKILGANQICNPNSQTYTVDNLSPSATVNWSVTPSGSFTLIQNGNNATLTPVGGYNGNAILTASVGSNCENVLITKTIWVGVPSTINELSHVPVFGCTMGEINAQQSPDIEGVYQ